MVASAGVLQPQADEQSQAEMDEHAGRYQDWTIVFPVTNSEEAWLVGVIVDQTFRYDRCRAEERVARRIFERRARLCWKEDRMLAIEKLAIDLPRKPTVVARALRESRYGCDWLIQRWTMLGRILEAGDEWNDEQMSLAHDMLGTPKELRAASTALVAAAGSGSDTKSVRARVVDYQIAALNFMKGEVLDEQDRCEQQAAAHGVELEPDALLARVRRTETKTLRTIQWAQRLLDRTVNPPAEVVFVQQKSAPAATPFAPAPPAPRRVSPPPPAPTPQLQPLAELSEPLIDRLPLHITEDATMAAVKTSLAVHRATQPLNISASGAPVKTGLSRQEKKRLRRRGNAAR
jgi:hypothetical protein